jgi:undecaprenyl-diphosphatase
MRCRTSRLVAQPPAPSPAQALALGALHGAAELLPVSSSAHVATVPWLLGWDYVRLEDAQRKSFEVALHAGAAAAWLISPATEGAEVLRTLIRPNRGRLAFLLLSGGPAAAAGLALEGPIERRLGSPATIAFGLVAGALAMVRGDREAQRRQADEAQPADAFWLGVAQAAALAPGVSRSGATLAAARFRGFTRPASRSLSARAGVPVIAGATGLKLIRALQRPPAPRGWLAIGAASSFASTCLLAPRLERATENVPLMTFAAYRLAVAGAIAARLRAGRAHAGRRVSG